MKHLHIFLPIVIVLFVLSLCRRISDYIPIMYAVAFGLMKVVDDHYDTGIYSSTFMHISAILFLLIYARLSYINRFTCIQTFMSAFALLLFAPSQFLDRNGKIVPYYIVGCVMLLALSIMHVSRKGIRWMIRGDLLFYTLLGAFLVLVEDRLFPEEYSERKVYVRLGIVVIAIVAILHQP